MKHDAQFKSQRAVLFGLVGVILLCIVLLSACEPNPLNIGRSTQSPLGGEKYDLPYCTSLNQDNCIFDPNVWVPETPSIPTCTAEYHEEPCYFNPDVWVP